MGRIRASRRAELRTATAITVVGLALVGCAASSFETATSLPEAPRRTDGVVVDREPARPAPAERVAVASVVAVLPNDVERVVRAYVLALVREDLAALEELLAEGARPMHRAGGRQQLLDAFRARMKVPDGVRAGAPPSPRLAEITIFDQGALDGRESAPARPEMMGASDLLVRVPMTRAPGDARFGDVLVLLLRRESGRLRVVAQADES